MGQNSIPEAGCERAEENQALHSDPSFPSFLVGKAERGRQNDLHLAKFWTGPAKRFTPNLKVSQPPPLILGTEEPQKFLNTKMQEPCQRALFGQRWLIFGNKTVRSVWMNVIRMKFG